MSARVVTKGGRPRPTSRLEARQRAAGNPNPQKGKRMPGSTNPHKSYPR